MAEQKPDINRMTMDDFLYFWMSRSNEREEWKKKRAEELAERQRVGHAFTPEERRAEMLRRADFDDKASYWKACMAIAGEEVDDYSIG